MVYDYTGNKPERSYKIEKRVNSEGEVTYKRVFLDDISNALLPKQHVDKVDSTEASTKESVTIDSNNDKKCATLKDLFVKGRRKITIPLATMVTIGAAAIGGPNIVDGVGRVANTAKQSVISPLFASEFHQEGLMSSIEMARNIFTDRGVPFALQEKYLIEIHDAYNKAELEPGDLKTAEGRAYKVMFERLNEYKNTKNKTNEMQQ